MPDVPTNAQLKDLLKHHGLKQSGNKAALIKRLENAGVDPLEAYSLESNEGGGGVVSQLALPIDSTREGMEHLEPEQDKVGEVKNLIPEITEQVNEIEIDSAEDYTLAGNLLTEGIKPALKQIKEIFNPIIRHWQDGKALTVKQKKSLERPLLNAEEIIKRKLIEYSDRLEREAEEEAERLRVEAEEEAERELHLRAAELYEQGEDEQAEKLLGIWEGEEGEGEEGEGDSEWQGEWGDDEELVDTEHFIDLTPSISAPKPTAEGVSIRKSWDYEISNEGEINREFLKPDLGAIRKMVNAYGVEAAEKVGGIKVFEKKTVAGKVR